MLLLQARPEALDARGLGGSSRDRGKLLLIARDLERQLTLLARTQATRPTGPREHDRAKVPGAWRRDMGRSWRDANVVAGTRQARPFRRGLRDCAQGAENRACGCQENGRETADGRRQEGLSEKAMK